MQSIEYLVIGGGILGLACARELSLANKEVLVIEQENQLGQHTSSRNSEVIHAGIYYPPNSLKATHCIRGKQLLYNYCQKKRIPHKKIGKLLVATQQQELSKLEDIYKQAIACGMRDLHWLTQSEITQYEPNLACAAALYSPTTGIIDTHQLMLCLQGEIEQSNNSVVCQSKFIAAENLNTLQLILESQNETLKLYAKNIINCAGLWATEVLNHFVPDNQIETLFVKGNYFALSGASPFSHLIYPVPSNGGLGIHSTLDMQGQTRFGPDVVKMDSINYDVMQEREIEFRQAIAQYWPEIMDRELAPAYAGIRTKYINGQQSDFLIHQAHINSANIISYLGIESPGITAALSLAQTCLNN